MYNTIVTVISRWNLLRVTRPLICCSGMQAILSVSKEAQLSTYDRKVDSVKASVLDFPRMVHLVYVMLVHAHTVHTRIVREVMG